MVVALQEIEDLRQEEQPALGAWALEGGTCEGWCRTAEGEEVLLFRLLRVSPG